MTSSEPIPDLTPEQCRRRLSHPSLTVEERVQVLCRLGKLLADASDVPGAIACFEEARTLQPDSRLVLRHWGQLLTSLGQYHEAITAFERAIALSAEPDGSLWRDLGDAQRQLRQYRPALTSYQQATALNPEDWQAWNGQSYVQAMLRRHRDARASSDRALELNPDSEEVWSGRGIVLFAAGRYQPALDHFDRALALQPDYDRAWYNRGVTLVRLGRDREAMTSLDRAIALGSPADAWYVTAWLSKGFALMKLGQFQLAIASLDQVQRLQPDSYAAALYRLICVLLGGKLPSHLRLPQTRRQLGHSLKTVLLGIRYRILILVGAIALLIFGQGTWADWLRQIAPTLFSLGIIALIVADLWLLRDRISFVWRTYFRSGLLAYVRALGILIITLSTFLVANAYAPPALHWGWANLVFGQPGNILFQPFNLVQPDPLSTPHSAPPATTAPAISDPPPSPATSPTPDPLPTSDSAISEPDAYGQMESTLPVRPAWSYGDLFVLGFWGLLIMGIPFWARLEERVFRWGGNSWRQIAVRSTLFGLVHLIVGIPILAGFVLIVPGFLFACRYKFVFSRHLRRSGDILQAQDAGMLASTADHAIYNAILVTLVTITLILL
jgi:tetratricopeptide (TPR) repeat protein